MCMEDVRGACVTDDDDCGLCDVGCLDSCGLVWVGAGRVMRRLPVWPVPDAWHLSLV
jgi:hypothetical protein